MAGGRKIKSVSIPERLFDRVESIPNFTQFVVSALESDDGRAASAIEGRATDRRAHMQDLADNLIELENVLTMLGNVRRTPPRHRMQAIQAMEKQVRIMIEGLKDHREDVRRRS